MIISSRTRTIIYYLKQNNRFVTVREIAEKLDLTERTVYRELPDITQVLDSCGVKLESVTGKGMKLSGIPSAMEELSYLLNKVPDDGYSAAQRIVISIFTLMHESDYVKTQALAITAKTSIQTIRNDLKIIKKSLSREDLTLVVKKGEGVLIAGKEIDKSHYFTKILIQYIDLDGFFNWIIDKKDYGDPLLQLLDKHGYWDITKKLFNIVMSLINSNDIKVSDADTREFLLMLVMLVTRRNRGCEYDAFKYEQAVSEKKALLAKVLIEAMQNVLDFTVTEQEIPYIYWLLNIIITQPKENATRQDELEIANNVTQFIAEVETRLGLPLNVDIAFVDSLIAHMNRALSRIRSGLLITNPISKEIEQNYQELFEIVRESSSITFLEESFPDEEIAYLVLYIAMALDQVAANSFRVLVVCTSGMGSSKMLATRLDREIAEVKIKKVIALTDLSYENLEEYDLIISTVPLYLDDHSEYIMVSPLLTKEEVAQVKERVRRHRTKKLSKISKTRNRPAAKDCSDSLILLQEIRAITQLGIDIMNNVKVVPSLGLQTDIIKGMGSFLYRIELTDDPDLLANSMSSNEGCFIVPNTKLAYSEFCLAELQTPILLVIKLDNEKTYAFGANELVDINSMTVLLYPRLNESYFLDFLHVITLMILENPDSIEAFAKGDERAIQSILGERITDYLAYKL